jgi:hypothetical protein
MNRRSILSLLGIAPIAATANSGFAVPPEAPFAEAAGLSSVAAAPMSKVLQMALASGVINRDDLRRSVEASHTRGGIHGDSQVDSWRSFSASAKERIKRERYIEREIDSIFTDGELTIWALADKLSR